MRKMLTVLMTFSMVLAGCMDLTDEDVESIVDSIVDFLDVMTRLHTIMTA